MRYLLVCLLYCVSLPAMAQEDSTEIVDYSQFGDAQGVKRYCNQKVLNQTPQRIVSFGMEQLGRFEVPDLPLSAMLPAMQSFSATGMFALKAQVNIPVISTNKIIWQLGANYWGSRIAIENPGTHQLANKLAIQLFLSP
jgi:hypothetical protein